MIQPCQPGQEVPVTVSISRQIKPGREADYEQWFSGVIDAAGSFKGHLGTNILRPSTNTAHQYAIIYRFDTYQNCQQWEASDTRKEWLRKLEPLVEGEAETRRSTGLEFWFDLPQLPAQKPATWKMSVILIVVVFLILMGIHLLLGPTLSQLPLWLRTFIVVVFQVLLMTYLIMPRVTLLLKDWLFNNSK